MGDGDRFDRIVSVATDGELPFIEAAAFRAGVLWRCTARPPEFPLGCGYNNDEHEARCGDCGAPRPAEESA